MGTLIKSIAFQNFYNYFGTLKDNTFTFTSGINIISADNNMGKSKFYNGILWILKDQVYDSDLKMIQSAGASFIKMASSKAKSMGEPFTMAVMIEYSNGQRVYEVSKSVRFNKSGDKWEVSGQTVDIVETSHGSTTPIYDTSQQTRIIEGIIPTQLREYALLQGESMEKIVDLSSKDGLQKTIETLADIGDIVKIKTNCLTLSRLARSLYNDQQASNTQRSNRSKELLDEKATLDDRINNHEVQLENLNNDLSIAKETKERYEALIENASSRESYRSAIREVDAEIQRLKETKQLKEAAITAKLYSDRPWLLIGHGDSISTFVAKRDELVTARALKMAQKKVLEDPSTILLPEGSPDVPSLRRMLKLERCEVCGRPAPKGTEPWLSIQRLIERPKENAPKTANDFSRFFSDIQISAGGVECDNNKLLESVASYRDEIRAINDAIDKKREELADVQARFINVGGNTNDESKDKSNLSEFQLANRNIEKYTAEIARIKEAIGRWKTRIEQIDAELNANSTDSSIQRYQDFRDLVLCVERLVDSAKERIFDRILDELRKDANEKYKDLLKGNPVEGGTLTFDKQSDGTVHVSIKNAENGELTGLGTGFQRMKQLSIIMAIISTKVGDNRFDYPFISDAPFSEFGDNFIKNFFRIAPNVFTQSIIMVKDLYDVDAPSNMNPLGEEIYNRMKRGEIPGTFYINYIEERSDVTSLVTKTKKYI